MLKAKISKEIMEFYKNNVNRIFNCVVNIEQILALLTEIQRETKKRFFYDLENKLVNDLEYPQKKYAYLLHKKDLEELKKRHF